MVMIKFSIGELCSIIDCINSGGGRAIKETHSSEKQFVMIDFGKYERNGEHVGYSFRAVKKLKEDTTVKPSFVFGFKFQEAVLLKSFLTDVLRKTYTLIEEKAGDDEEDPILATTPASTPTPAPTPTPKPKSKSKPKPELEEKDDEEIW
jgi:hypothetical protein